MSGKADRRIIRSVITRYSDEQVDEERTEMGTVHAGDRRHGRMREHQAGSPSCGEAPRARGYIGD